MPGRKYQNLFPAILPKNIRMTMNRDFFICPSERVFLFAFLFFTPNQYKSINVFLYVFVFSIFKVLILSVNNEHHTP